MPQQAWRRRRPNDEPLPRLDGALDVRSSRERCHAIGLIKGDCPQRRVEGSHYCFYHEKLRLGLTEPSAEVYPVWPLPEDGYVLTDTVSSLAS